MTVSTRAAEGRYADRSGPELAGLVSAAGHAVVETRVVRDGVGPVTEALTAVADSGDADLVLTTGGTGISPSDRTPEATQDVCDRLVPGIAEAIRVASLAVTPRAALSRAVAGTRGTVLIVNLPGSPGGARDGWSVLAPIVEHAVGQLGGADHGAG